jgi:hypothetical protein
VTDRTTDRRTAAQRAGASSFHSGAEDQVLGRPAPAGADQSYLRGAEYARAAGDALPAPDEDLPRVRASREAHARRAAGATDEQLRRVVRLHPPECDCAYHEEIARRAGPPADAPKRRLRYRKVLAWRCSECGTVTLPHEGVRPNACPSVGVVGQKVCGATSWEPQEVQAPFLPRAEASP